MRHHQNVTQTQNALMSESKMSHRRNNTENKINQQLHDTRETTPQTLENETNRILPTTSNPITPTEPHYPRTSTPQPIETTPITNPFPLNIEETTITQNLQPQSRNKDEAQTIYFSSLFIFIIAIALSIIAFNTTRNAIQEKNKIQIETMKFHTKLVVAIKELTPTNCRHNNHIQEQGHKRPITYQAKIEQIKHNIKEILSCITQNTNHNPNTPTARISTQITPNTQITTMNNEGKPQKTTKITQTTRKPKLVTPNPTK